MKLRSEEVYGAFYLAHALGWPDESEYRIAAEYADMDIEIRNGPDLHRLQVTTAGPIWPEGSPHWGVDHKLQMKQLRESGISSGWGPFKQLPSGEIVNNDSVISRDERDAAFGAGLLKALTRKTNHRSPDLELVIKAADYGICDPETFKELANEKLRATPVLGFAAVHFVTNKADVYFCSRN